MQRLIMFCMLQPDYNEVCDLFQEGWVLDPDIYDGRPLRLENGVVYHLVRYESGEEPTEEAAVEPKILSIKSVPINEADDLLQQGYVLKDTFAKTVTLIRYEQPEDEVEKEPVCLRCGRSFIPPEGIACNYCAQCLAEMLENREEAEA